MPNRTFRRNVRRQLADNPNDQWESMLREQRAQLCDELYRAAFAGRDVSAIRERLEFIAEQLENAYHE